MNETLTSVRKLLAQWAKIGRSVYRELRAEVKRLWNKLPQARRRQVSVAVVSLITLSIVVISLTGLGIYAFGWENTWSKAMARVIPYPAGFTDFSAVNYYDYLVEKRTADVYYRNQDVTAAKIKQQAFNQALNHVLVAREAKRLGLAISSREVKEEVDRIFASQGGEEESMRIIREEYGLRRSDFEGRVYHQLLRLKVDQALYSSTKYLQAARQRAGDVIARLGRNEDFFALAKEYSAHPTAFEEGDKAMVLASSLPAVVKAKAQELADGELYDKPMKVESSYYILKRIRAVPEGLQVQVIQVAADNSSTWLSEAYAKQRLTHLLPGLR